MKINKISSKLIKPHTPTPHNLKNYKLSFIDKDIEPMNVGVVLFYESKPEDYTQLKESLAKILVDFYPLAGRYIKNVNDLAVDCSDEGAELVEAEALDVELIDLVGKTEIQQLLPDQYFKLEEAADYPLLSIQATRFPCGGVAIAVCISHRVFDMSSVATFIAAWSSASNPDRNKMVDGRLSPSFQLSSLLPCKDDDGECSLRSSEDRKNIVQKRLLFDKVALAGLKSKMRPRNDGKTVSRVRLACAVTAKSLIGLDCAKHGRSRDLLISQPVNMRERTVFLPQPKHSCGNFVIATLTRRVSASEAELFGIQELVDLMGDGVQKNIYDHAQMLSPDRNGRDIYMNGMERFIKELSNPGTNAIIFTDCSKFEFYEADFGWGKPIWISAGSYPSFFNVCTSNKEGDGIEVLVHLFEEDVAHFEQDEEIKKFMKPVRQRQNENGFHKKPLSFIKK